MSFQRVAPNQALATRTGLDMLPTGASVVDAAIAADTTRRLPELASCGSGGDVYGEVIQDLLVEPWGDNHATHFCRAVPGPGGRHCRTDQSGACSGQNPAPGRPRRVLSAAGG